MNAVQRRNKLRAELTQSTLPHVRRWKAMARLRDCLSPLIQAAFNAGRTRDTLYDREIVKLRQEIVDCSYIIQYEGEQ